MKDKGRKKRIQEILKLTSAILTDTHVVYTSGRHGNAYINKDAIYPFVGKISELCEFIAEEFLADEIEVVIAPAIGGVTLSQWTAHHLTQLTFEEVLGIYAEKTEDGKDFVIKRGYNKLLKGKRVLVVEDVLTTGGSVKKVIQQVREEGGEVIGLAALCNRGGVKPEDVANPPKMVSLLNISLQSWAEGDCPLCKAGVPINTDVGKGRDFLARKSK